MDIVFNRRDIGYTIISRFEESFRGFLSEGLTIYFDDFLDGIPSGIVSKAKDRTAKAYFDDAIDLLENTDFPDLKETVCYKNMYKDYFPNISFSISDFENLMEEIYNLRCKIAHVKGYFTSLDLDKLLENTQKIALYLENYGEIFNDFVKDLKSHPERVIIPTPLDFAYEDNVFQNIPNNVPTPDYEYEGGFVGREDDIKKVTDLLEGDLHRVITISGAGGVGKTALALRIIQKLMRKSDRKFDGVVWLSAKETKLSYLGIEDIEPTIKNHEQLLDTIFEVMEFGVPRETIEEKEADVQTIFDLHQYILIVIDNLETISDERIIDFIIDSHKKIKVLITSRRGLGQVERRYDLKQLKEKEAIYLFRQVAKDKYLNSLAQLNDMIIKNYVKEVSYYPLAIKWVVGQVALGKDINSVVGSINETTSDISHFCFDQIYHGLTGSAKKLLCALSCFDEPPSAGVLQYVVDINQNDLEDKIHELILVSLVIPDQYKNEQNEIARRYILLSLTRGYVRQQLDKEPALKRDIEEGLRSVQNTIEEAGRATRQYRSGLSNLGAVTEEEKVAAMIALTATQKYQSGKYVDAVDDYKRACQIAPRFASLYRNWAFMESQEGHSVEADRLMEKAAQLNPNDVQIWLTWGNMKRRGGRIKEALDRYEKAYGLTPDDKVVLNALGQAKSRIGEYAKADELFRQALQTETPGWSIRNEIINRTSLAENLSRWAESLSNDRNHKLAEIK